jgi:hypothetical protein
MSSAARDPWGDPDDEARGNPFAWLPTPTVPFPRPAPGEEPAAEVSSLSAVAFAATSATGRTATGRTAMGRTVTGRTASRAARSDEGPRSIYASWGRRVLGYVVDLAVMTVPLLIALAYDDPTVVALGITWALGWFVGNRVLTQGRTGTTLGRHLTGTQLWQTPDTPPPGARTALLRELAHVVDVVCLVGLVRPLWDARGRTIADSLCGTTVGRV